MTDQQGKWAPDGECRKQSPCPECSRHPLERVGNVEIASPNGPRESQQPGLGLQGKGRGVSH